MPTTGSGLFPYPNSSAVPDVPADILLLAQKIDLIASGWTVTADATTRAALVTNSFAYEGLHVYQIDTKALYIYQSSAWVLQSASAVGPIIPGSPTSTGGTASVSANGEVTFGGSTSSLLVPSVFSTSYITEIEIEILTASAAANCNWVLVTGAGSDLTTGYTTNMAQAPTTAGALSSVANITTAWQNLRVGSTAGGHAIFRVARAADTKRKSMFGSSIDSTTFDLGAGWNTSTAAHTGVRFNFAGITATGVVRFRSVSNLT